MHSVDEIKDILDGHFQRFENDRTLFRELRAAADNRLWSQDGPFGRSSSFGSKLQGYTDRLPIKVQVNTLRPYLEREKASLYRHQPRVTVKRPTILSSSSRRAKGDETEAKALAEFGTTFLRAERMRRTLEDAHEQALLYPGCALKIGWDEGKKGSPLARLWVQVVQRWDAGWDERVTDPDQQRYRFHLRWERLDLATKRCPGLATKRIEQTRPVGDYLAEGVPVAEGVSDRTRANGYVQLVEWWDLEAGEVQVFVVDGTSVEACGSTPQPIRYRFPDGSPLVQLIPVVLANTVGLPMQATTLALPAFHETVEKSLITSHVVCAMRRSLSRVALYDLGRKNRKDAIGQISDAGDLELVGVEDVDSLDNVVRFVEWPDVSPILDKAYRYVGLLAAESSSQSALGRGQTQGLEYAAATTAQVLAQGDAAAKALPAERMAGYMAELVRCAFAILATERAGLSIEYGGEVRTISPSKLAQEWEIGLDGTAAAAARQAEQRAGLLQAVPLLTAAVTTAATEKMPPGPDGKEQEIPGPIRVASQRIVDLFVDAFELPDQMRWRDLIGAEPDYEDEEEDEEEDDDKRELAQSMLPPAPAAPMAPAGPAPVAAPMVDPEVEALAASFSDEELAAMQAALEG
jgi:hypothetical protein